MVITRKNPSLNWNCSADKLILSAMCCFYQLLLIPKSTLVPRDNFPDCRRFRSRSDKSFSAGRRTIGSPARHEPGLKINVFAPEWVSLLTSGRSIRQDCITFFAGMHSRLNDGFLPTCWLGVGLPGHVVIHPSERISLKGWKLVRLERKLCVILQKKKHWPRGISVGKLCSDYVGSELIIKIILPQSSFGQCNMQFGFNK